MKRDNYPLHIVLFLLTVVTTTMAGASLATGRMFIFSDPPLGLPDMPHGLAFSFAFLSFLTVHEFGHYFTAMYHRVRCSLPYYIPIFIPLTPYNIGSFGAVIRIREQPESRRKYFDIGVAGPLAGFVVALAFLVIGFATLPPMEETVMGIHPEYRQAFGGIPTLRQLHGVGGEALTYGGSLLFEGIKALFAGSAEMPPDFELLHYPFIFAGFLGLFFTALNLLPVGQFDGGHVVYGLLGARRAGVVARVAVLFLTFVGGYGILSWETMNPAAYAETGDFIGPGIVYPLVYLWVVHLIMQGMFRDRKPLEWVLMVAGMAALQFGASLVLDLGETNLLWLIYAVFSVRVIKVDHPVAADDTPLTFGQKILGVLALLIFVLCFTLSPLWLI